MSSQLFLCNDSESVLVFIFINEAEKSCDVIKRGDNYFENLPIYCTGFHPK